jgi:hypothetical protein
MLCRDQPELLDALHDADMVLPDGKVSSMPQGF